MLRVGLPKGVVMKQSLSVIARLLGTDVLPARQLRFLIPPYYCVHLLKHRDIPGLIRDGYLDVGVSSTEWTRETGVDLPVVHELDWCTTRISVIAANGTEVRQLSSKYGRALATEFPGIAAEHLRTRNEPHIRIWKVSGSTESLVPEPFTFGIECVETGRTLSANGLREIEVILDATTVCLATSSALAHPNLQPFIASLSA